MGIKTYQKTVSIIMPCFNSEAFIGRAINSVLNQTFTDWELIIVDDASTDSSRQIVNEYLLDCDRILLIESRPNGGTALVRNKGLQKASGRYIVFLDSDDEWSPMFLKEQMLFITNNKCAVATASYFRKAKKSKTVFHVPSRIGYKTLLNGNPLSCLTTIFDREDIGLPFFDVSLRKCEDYAYWLDIMKKGFIALGNDFPLATYHIIEKSKSRAKFSLIKHMWKVYRKTQHLSVIASLYHLSRWAFYGLSKYRDVR